MEFSKHGQGTTSVKVHHAPGGSSNFSLGWDTPDTAPKKKTQQPVATQPPAQQQPPSKPAQTQQNKEPAGKTSVKVHNPPGGRSNFTLG